MSQRSHYLLENARIGKSSLVAIYSNDRVNGTGRRAH